MLRGSTVARSRAAALLVAIAITIGLAVGAAAEVSIVGPASTGYSYDGALSNASTRPLVARRPAVSSMGTNPTASLSARAVTVLVASVVAPEGEQAVDDVLPKPKVSDPKLQNYVDNLYKGTTNPARVGTGTTADAVRNELATGQPTGGTFHSIKAQETINGFERWLRTNPGASYSDRLVAQSLLDDLRSALGGGR